MYEYSNYSYSPTLILTVVLIYLAVLVISIATVWKIFKKAGQPGWASLVPIYNLYIFFEITWGNGLCFLLTLIPLVNIVIYCMTMAKLSKVFGRGGGFTAGLILLGGIFLPILAFGRSRYVGPAGSGATGSQGGFCPACGSPVDLNMTFCEKCGTRIK